MLKHRLEIVRFESAWKVTDRWCSSNVIRHAVPYCRYCTTKGMWSNFRTGWTRSSCLSSAEDLIVRRKFFSVIRDLRYVGLPDSRSQTGDLIVYAPLDWKPVKLLQSLGDADASPLTCDNASERGLQTLKPRNVLIEIPHEGRIVVFQATADEII